MIELAIKSTIVFALAAVVNTVLRHSSAARRHSVWMLAFLAIPFIALFPQWNAPVAALPTITIRATAVATAMAQPSTNFITPLWAFITAVLLARLALSYLLLRRRGTAGPFTAGVLRPSIYLPPSATSWPEAKRHSVVLHETAHIRRRDHVAHLFSQIVCAIIWFQPLAWYAAKRAASEREHACDDLVLASGVAPATYATHLLEVARESQRHPAVAVAMAARSTTLEGRLRAITSQATSRAGLSRRWRFVQCLALIMIVAGLQAQDEKIYELSSDKTLVAPKILHKVEPVYPADAKDSGVSGGVTMSIEINKEGLARNVVIVKTIDERFNANSIAAMKEWRFEPCKKDGKPVVCRAKVEMNFKLL